MKRVIIFATMIFILFSFSFVSAEQELWSEEKQITTDEFPILVSVFPDKQGNFWITYQLVLYGKIGYMKIDNNGNILFENLTNGYYYASIGIDSNNNAHLITQDGNYYKISPNGTILINKTFNGNLHIAIDSNDNSHIIWVNSTLKEIFYRKLDNNANVLINDTQITNWTNNPSEPSFVIDKENNIHIVYADKTTNWNLFYMKLNNYGNILINSTKITSNNSIVYYFPPIRKDENDNIHISWLDKRDYLYNNSSSNSELYYKKIDKNGNTILEEKRLTYNSSHKWDLDMAVINENEIYMIWSYDAMRYIKINKNVEILINDTKIEPLFWYSNINGAFSQRIVVYNDNVYLFWSTSILNEEISFEFYFKHTLPLPDITPSNISLSQTPYENQQIMINSTIQNLGKGNATNFTVSLIIDNQTIENKTISLLANSSLQISFNWTVSKGISEIKIAVNKDKKIIEKNESNNEISTFISVFPDITPSLFTSHNPSLNGDEVNISARILNIGNGNAENFSVKFYVDGINVKNFTLANLNFNENASLSFNYNFEKGNHTIKVVVDEENLIEELNEGNNEMSLGIVVNEKVVGGNSFYMNFFIIIGVAFFVAIIRKIK